jgi:membrane protease YdiL (CAAX protease family)
LREQDHESSDGGSRLRWLALVRVLFFVCSCAVVLAATARAAANFRQGWREFAIGTFASVGAFVLTMFFVRWDKLHLEDVGASFARRSLARLALGFLGGLLLVSLWAFVVLVSVHGRWIRAPGVDLHAAAVALAGYLALACREELAFRGYPLRRMEMLFRLWVAQIFVALIFAAEHKLGGSGWTDALLGSGVGSLLFGMAAIATRGLGVPIGVHAAWNFGQWFLGMKAEPGFLKVVAIHSDEKSAHLISTIAYITIMGLATVAFWLRYRRQQAERSRAQQRG